MWPKFLTGGATPKPREPEPAYGSIRIVPVGVDGFGVERYEIKNEKSRHPYYSWERIHGHTIGDTLEMCEHIARETLLAKETADANFRARNDATMAHHKANPPRIVTLGDLSKGESK